MHDGIGKYFFINSEDQPISSLNKWIERMETEKVVYEVIRVEDAVPLFLDDYINRLKNSFYLLGQELPITDQIIFENITKLFLLNKLQNGPVKIVFGMGDQPFNLFYIMKPHLPDSGGYENGVKTILMEEARNTPNAKVWNAELRQRSIEKLKKAKAYEAILVNSDGFLTEGSRSNLFLIKGDRIFTCPENLILPGITRKKVIEISGSVGINLTYKAIHISELSQFESCFLTGTSRKIVPIKSIDKFHFSVRNETLQLIISRFDEFVVNYIKRMKKKTIYYS